jgi:hypothetical protein
MTEGVFRRKGTQLKPFTFDWLAELFAELGGTVEKTQPAKFRVINLPGGETLTIVPTRVTFSTMATPDHATMKAFTLVMREAWPSAVVGGPLDFQRTALAYARAYGLPAQAENADRLTARDWAWIERKTAQLHVMEGLPPRPQQRTSGPPPQQLHA